MVGMHTHIHTHRPFDGRRKVIAASRSSLDGLGEGLAGRRLARTSLKNRRRLTVALWGERNLLAFLLERRELFQTFQNR